MRENSDGNGIVLTDETGLIFILRKVVGRQVDRIRHERREQNSFTVRGNMKCDSTPFRICHQFGQNGSVIRFGGHLHVTFIITDAMAPTACVRRCNSRLVTE